MGFGSLVIKFFLLKYNQHCECLIIFVKFLDWIVASWRGAKGFEMGATTKIMYIICIKN